MGHPAREPAAGAAQGVVPTSQRNRAEQLSPRSRGGASVRQEACPASWSTTPRSPEITIIGPRTDRPSTAAPELASASRRLAHWGFLAEPDLPDRPGDATLMVALRSRPTLEHFDPQRVEYWVSNRGRGQRAELTCHTALPLDQPFSWGLIRVVDRIPVSNDYLTFGGRLVADVVDDVLVAVFTSPAPLLRRGGHSQGWDPAATALGAFFARLMVAVDFAPGFESLVSAADPIARYAAFLADLTERYRGSTALRSADPHLWALLAAEERRLRRDEPSAWTTGRTLLAESRRPV